jgi:hypothetical protein
MRPIAMIDQQPITFGNVCGIPQGIEGEGVSWEKPESDLWMTRGSGFKPRLDLGVFFLEYALNIVAEWLGRRTLNQRVVGSNPRTSDSQPEGRGFESRPRHGVVSLSRIP